MAKSKRSKVQHIVEVRMPTPLWLKTRHLAIDHDLSASELIRRSIRLMQKYIESHGEPPPARPR
jgi:hypothetical protein